MKTRKKEFYFNRANLDFVYFCGKNPRDMEKTIVAKRKTNYESTLEACKEADVGKGTLFTDFEKFKCHIHTL